MNQDERSAVVNLSTFFFFYWLLIFEAPPATFLKNCENSSDSFSVLLTFMERVKNTHNEIVTQ